MLRFLWRATIFLWRAARGYRLRPWRSPYLRWRMETYWGTPAEKSASANSGDSLWQHRRDLARFLDWADANAVTDYFAGAGAGSVCGPLRWEPPEIVVVQRHRRVRLDLLHGFLGHLRLEFLLDLRLGLVEGLGSCAT